MSGASVENRLKAVEWDRTAAGSIRPALSDRPDLRLIEVGYLVSLLLIAAGVLLLLFPASADYKIGTGYVLIMALGHAYIFPLVPC